MKLIVLLSLSVIGGALCKSDDVLVEAPAGKFKGHYLKTRGGKDIASFEGIPYAMPPTGDLRFKDPVKIPRIEGVYEATDDSKECFQSSKNFTNVIYVSTYVGSEDCLYLNLYKPKMADSSSLLPVMVWIHGGGYFVGSGAKFWNGPDFLLDKDMVYVAINYRLGVLGFLHSPNHGIAGNFGMKDQVMALKWVQENIKAFGGDPNLVTIAGESAGGSSVSLLMHSPLAKGLFQRGIAQSGSIYSPFGADPTEVDSNEKTNYVIKNLGCSKGKSSSVECLQKKTTEEVIQSSLDIIADEIKFEMDFIPVLEEPSPNAFMTKDYYYEPSTIPLIIGVTSRETMMMLYEVAVEAKKYGGDITKMKKDLNTQISIWGRFKTHPDKKNINEKITKFYFGAGGNEDANDVQITNLMSDIMFNHGAHKTAKTEKGPTYMYKFSYIGKEYETLNPPESLKDGVGHAEDLRYFFKTSYFNPPSGKRSKKDEAMSKKLIDMWYNFMKYGNPTPDTNIWEESKNGINYLDITNDGLVMKTNMFEKRMKFFDELNIDRFS